uniref:Macaca fascicularis brain cDNA clone: QflA-18208, similar to human hypothetical protein FLJ39963 (FLJ39963), mRNA, RefSeq: NM_182633.1 n=1 Tax=Macaca fascicularis TaxID=9541 RepID=I7GI96_MACFA|nr:unnamed protein product [Macaca fascicularis]
MYSGRALEARSPKSRCWHGHTPEVSRGERFLASYSFWWLRHSLAFDCITPISASVFTYLPLLPLVSSISNKDPCHWI